MVLLLSRFDSLDVHYIIVGSIPELSVYDEHLMLFKYIR